MGFAFLVTFSMVGIILLVLVVLVGFIRRWQFSLTRLFGLAALFGLLLLPLVEAERRGEAMPHQVPLALDGSDRWVTPPLVKVEYRITLHYARDEPRRLRGTLALRLFDDTAGTLLFATIPTTEPFLHVYGSEDGVVVCQFDAIEGHRYRIEVDEHQARELARWHCRLTVEPAPAELGLP